MTEPAERSYDFGEFHLDAGERLLLRNGKPLLLTAKVFDTLLMLVQGQGRLIEKDEFMERLWPGTYVGEDTLAHNISLIRKALGDRNGQRFIATVPKRGYRFIAPVHQSPESAAASAPAPAKEASRWRRPAVVVALAAGLVLVAGVAAYFYVGRASRRTPESSPKIRAVAVLPLENLSRDPEQEYFAEGVTDELITNLAKIGALRVISRTSVMRYKGTKKSLPEIARELNVDAVVEGTVVHSPGRVHITAQLVSARPEQHLWAESYDRPLGDAVILQGELAHVIADTIRVKLTPQEQASLARSHAVDPEAYQAYLKGHFFWNKRTSEGFKKAIEYFQHAIDKDATYAQAYAGLADSYLLLGGYSVAPQAETIPKAKAAARRALEIDEGLAEAHATLGLIAGNYDWDWSEAERQYKRAIELNPNYATAHHWYGEGFLALMGRFDEAISEMEKAQALDPLSAIINTDAGAVLFFARQYDRAIEQLRKTLEMDPNFVQARFWLAVSYAQKGMFREAIADLQGVWQLDDTKVTLSVLGMVYGLSGQREKAQEVLAELKQLAGQRYIDPLCMVTVSLGLGEKRQTFAWFEKEYEAHSVGLTSLKVNPVYDSLRSDSRFRDLLHRVGLSP
jgi:TolB-like protein/DNA-binding winged helix-turn-helix (wHTH) protein/Flp pilus assembly protein TadD